MVLTVTLNAAIDKRYVVNDCRCGQVMRLKDCRYTAGGKGINVAKIARGCCAQVTATGFLGGFAGRYIESEVKKEGIECAFVSVEGESRSCVNLYDELTGVQTEFLEPGIEVNGQDTDRLMDEFTRQLDSCRVVCISGSVPRGTPPDTYARMIRLCRQREIPVLLDTSGELLSLGIEALPTMIKPNSDEIGQLLGERARDQKEILASMNTLHEKGIPIVALSLGKDGALFVGNDGIFRATTPDIPVINTVGCGDAMMAAFAVGLARKEPVLSIIRQAMAISTASALCEETGYFRQEDANRLLNMVEVFQIG